ncbi:MAG: bacterial extracellular solute-binding protein [Enterovirga sp.]|nr:bacterial extracellular solute-binding protein [Enterovirga sp.]
MLRTHVSRRSLLKATGGLAIAAAAPMSTAGAQEVRKVRLMHTQAGDPPMRKWFIDAIQQYNTLNKGVEVVAEFIPWNDAYPKVQAGIQSGSPPDLIHGDPFAYGALMASNLLEPTTDIIKAMGWDKDMFPNARVILRDGNDYLVPTWIEILGLFYRKDWLAEKGITAPFKSWDDVIRAGRALTEPAKGRWGVGMGLKRAGKIGDDFVSILYGLGGHLYNPDRTPAADTPVFRETLEIMRQLCECSPPDAVEWEYAGVRTGYKSGKVGLHLYEPRTMTEILGQPFGGYGSGFPQLIDVTGWQLLPGRSSEQWPDQAIARASLEGFSILKNSPNKAEAAKFVTWLLQDRARYTSMLQTVPLMELPLLSSVVNDDAYWDHPSYKRVPDYVPALKAAANTFGRGKIVNRKMDVYADTGLVIPESSVALGSLAVDDAVLSYVLEKKPIDQVIATLNEKLARFVKS